MPIVYVLTNPALDGYVKIGRTIDLTQRLRQLDNTSVPLPFRCVYAVDVPNEAEAERLLHQAFADHRTRPNREFFKIDPQRVIAAMKLTGGKDVTPRDDIAEDDTGIEALSKAVSKRRNYVFDNAGVKVGDVLTYSGDDGITAEVVTPKKILFEGEQMSVSKAALILLHREGYTWKSVNGWQYWGLDGQTLSERLSTHLADADDEEDE